MALYKTYVLLSMLIWATVAWSSPADFGSYEVEENRHRGSRLFNFSFLPFVKVNVQPTDCSAKSDNSTGTCLTKDACTREGGKEDGTCASGYGVCCVYEKRCGSTIKRNVTYLVNTEYPEALSDIGNCQYNIEKANNNICQLRLDFLTLSLKGPDATTSECKTDTFTFVGNVGANPTVICGQNTGQHMYLDLGQGAGAARINIATTDGAFDRSWRIRVTQISCNSPSRAPPKCLQYHTEYSGTISSFNYQDEDGVHQLGDQRYTICIRTREGFCGIRYEANENQFSLSGDGTAETEDTAISGDADCTKDFIIIPAVDKDGKVTKVDRYCGNKFEELITFSQPFEIRVVTENTEEEETANRGFSLRYTQIPC